MTTDGQTAGGRCIVAGVDEAGFGPLLGPLIIGATAWHVPAGCGGDELWDRLRGGVTRKPSKRRPGVAINDSKKIYSSKRGLADLECGVLVTMAVQSRLADGREDKVSDGAAPTFGRFLDRVAPGWAEQVGEHPWYHGCGEMALPVESDQADLATRSNGLRVALGRGGVRFLGAGLELVLETRFNQLSDAIGNKSRMLFCCTARLIQRLFDRFGGEKLTVLCDKQGGRDSYGRLLQQHWPDLKLTVLAESAERSGYQLAEPGPPGRAMELWFSPGADLKFLPASLASMYCKYTRELFMRQFNQFWRRQVGDDLQATAGYYADGQRFIGQVAEAVKRLGVDLEKLIRKR